MLHSFHQHIISLSPLSPSTPVLPSPLPPSPPKEVKKASALKMNQPKFKCGSFTYQLYDLA